MPVGEARQINLIKPPVSFYVGGSGSERVDSTACAARVLYLTFIILTQLECVRVRRSRL